MNPVRHQIPSEDDAVSHSPSFSITITVIMILFVSLAFFMLTRVSQSFQQTKGRDYYDDDEKKNEDDDREEDERDQNRCHDGKERRRR